MRHTIKTTEKTLSRNQPGFIGRYAIPAIVAIGATATTVAALGQMPTTLKTVLEDEPSAVESIEFTAFTDTDVVAIIEEACIKASCRGEDVHPMIRAYADAMDYEQLDAARWAQVRLVKNGKRRLDAAVPGSDAAIAAHDELSAAARVAYFYTTRISTMR